VYNADGQLCKTVRIEGDHAITEYYAYLSLGERSRKVTETHETESGYLVALATVAYAQEVEFRVSYAGTNMSYDGEVVVGAETTQKWVITRIINDQGQVGKITKNKTYPATTEKITYNLIDHLDNASGEVDKEGNLISYENYYPYGGISMQHAVDETKNVGYSGEELDLTKLNYFGFRYLDSTTGRWITPDPIRFEGKQLNLYAMVGGNPITFRDVFGLMPKEIKKRKSLSRKAKSHNPTYNEKAIRNNYQKEAQYTKRKVVRRINKGYTSFNSLALYKKLNKNSFPTKQFAKQFVIRKALRKHVWFKEKRPNIITILYEHDKNKDPNNLFTINMAIPSRAKNKRFHKESIDNIQNFTFKNARAGLQGQFNAFMQHRVTEAIGEAAALRYMAWKGNYSLAFPVNPGHGAGIDQLWIQKDNNGKIKEILVVEAKGPGARLASKQMSLPWVKNNLAIMAKNWGNYSSETNYAQLANELLDRDRIIGDPDVTGIVVSVKPQGVNHSTFKLSVGQKRYYKK